jgi:hypothetical protein
MSGTVTQPQWSRAAVASLVLGLLPLVLLVVARVPALVLGLVLPVLLGVVGVPALVLGYRGLYEVNSSEGRLSGRRCAIVGMVLGLAGCAASVALLIFLILLRTEQASLRTQCTDHLRRVGMGLLFYADQHQGAFPPGTAQGTKLPPEERVSWQGLLLPALEVRRGGASRWASLAGGLDLHQAWDAPANAAATGNEVITYRCPADPQAGRPPVNLTNYVGLAGVGLDAARYPLEDSRAGFFGYDRILTVKFHFEEGRIVDDLPVGLSNTFAVTETLRDLGPWAQGGRATVRGLDPDQVSYFGPGAPFGGLHPDGFNLLKADGSVEFKNNDFPADLFRWQVRLHREE